MVGFWSCVLKTIFAAFASSILSILSWGFACLPIYHSRLLQR